MGAWKGGKDREAQNLPEISVELRSHDQVSALATCHLPLNSIKLLSR